MADSDSTLEILIKLGVIGQADVKAANELLAQSTREAGKAADYLDPAMAQAGKAMGSAAEESKKLGSQFRLLALGARDAGAEIPGLSILLRGLLNPTTIGLAAGIAGIEAYFGHLQRVQQQQLEWIQSLQKTNDALHDITSSGKSAAEQLVEINKALADGQVKATGLSHSIELTTQMWKAYDEQVKGAASTQQQADADAEAGMNARIDQLQKAGILTKENADALKNLAAFEAEVTKARDERAAKEAEYRNTDLQLTSLIKTRNQLPSERDSQEKLFRDQNDLTRVESIITGMPKIIQDLEKERDSAQERRDPKVWREKFNQVIEDQQILAKATAEHPELAERVARDKDTIAARDTLNKKIDDLTGQLNVLNQTIAALDKTQAGHLEASRKQLDLKNYGGEGGFGGIISKGVQDIDAYQHGQRLTQQNAEELAAFRLLVETLGGNSTAVVNLVKTSIAHHKDVRQIISEIQRDLNNLRHRGDRPPT